MMIGSGLFRLVNGCYGFQELFIESCCINIDINGCVGFVVMVSIMNIVNGFVISGVFCLDINLYFFSCEGFWMQ